MRKNCLLAKGIYDEKQLDKRFMQLFDETGSIEYKKTDRTKTVLNEEN